MQVTTALPDSVAILEAVLDGFVQAAAAEVAAGVVPPYPDDAGVKYVEEGAGQERWKLPHEVVQDGHGDCEDLALWEAGGMRATGEDPSATVRLMKTGVAKLHAVVLRSDGAVSDPSARLKARARVEKHTQLRGVGSLCGGCGGVQDEGWDISGPGDTPGITILARNDRDVRSGKQYVRPQRKNPRPVVPQAGIRYNPATGQQYEEGFDKNRQYLDPADNPYAGSPYYPPGYYPGGPPGYGYYPSSPMPYGDPYNVQPMYGYSQDSWGQGGDSPYGWVWGNAPMVTYEDLYGAAAFPDAYPLLDPSGIDGDENWEGIE